MVNNVFFFLFFGLFIKYLWDVRTQRVYETHMLMYSTVYAQREYLGNQMYILNVYRYAVQCIYPMYIEMHYNVYTQCI